MKTELFKIPFEKNFIIYAPLKQAAFIGNEALASLASRLVEGRTPSCVTPEVSKAISFIKKSGVLAPDPPLPGADRVSRYEPICATLFLTNRCNLRCIYCYADSGKETSRDMPVDLGLRAIDAVCEHALSRGLSSFELGFHGGGEPTLNWKVLKECVDYARKKPLRAVVSASSNGCYHAKQRSYILDHFDGLSLSFDGPAEIQNLQRPLVNGRASFPVVMKTIAEMDRRSFRYGVRMTVTPLSARALLKSIAFLAEYTGVKLIQVEPAFPRGRGKGMALSGGWADCFIEAFKEAHTLASLRGIELFYSGARPGALGRQFCLAPRDALVVMQTGEVSTCFEVYSAEHPLAGDFIIGKMEGGKITLNRKKWLRIANRTVETLPYCRDCFCKFHCAGDCLSKTYYAAGRGLFRPSVRCEINRELTKHLILRRIQAGNGLWAGHLNPGETETSIAKKTPIPA